MTKIKRALLSNKNKTAQTKSLTKIIRQIYICSYNLNFINLNLCSNVYEIC